MRGKIEKLVTKKGSDRPTFGFIEGEDNESYFFIPAGMQRTSPVTWDGLAVGMKVEFTVIGHAKGPRAIEVLVLE